MESNMGLKCPRIHCMGNGLISDGIPSEEKWTATTGCAASETCSSYLASFAYEVYVIGVSGYAGYLLMQPLLSNHAKRIRH